MHLNDWITLTNGLVVYGCRGQVDDAGCRCREFRQQAVHGGGVEQRPDEKDGVDPHEGGTRRAITPIRVRPRPA
ncbi:hypothetical protein N5079_18810 [Planotetraspora sp. A-T 1434]|uniref:hypothetical protein n=1 Tax=Planotetraspora sp. A-T 1434 TaxID=2979219 RepID=UPI0021BEF4C7|nr:hypothetical protein [Planotetraspora sp. A-T 1434]MCT9932255.1 hypothetical protein [Planotetraspora sp. A-T 1434]